MIKKPVGGKVVSVTANTEIISNENCGTNKLSYIKLSGFYIRNEDSKDILIKINKGSEVLLKPKEMINLSNLTDVESCVIITEGSIRWGGLI